MGFTDAIFGLPGRLWGGWFNGAGTLQPAEAPPKPGKPADAPPPEGQGAAAVADGAGFGGGVGWGEGGIGGYGQRRKGNAAVYLDLLADPVVAAARAYALNPIRGATWRIASKPDADEDLRKYVEDVFCPPLLSAYRDDAVWGVDMGWAGWRCQWTRRPRPNGGGYRYDVKLVPCRQEASGILYDKDSGDFLGVKWNNQQDLWATRNEAFVYTYDRRGQGWLGRSRLENVIDAVDNWRDANDNTAKLANKSSGIVVGIGYPPGKGVDSNGQPVTRATQADNFGKVITSGAGYYRYPTLGSFTADDLQRMSPADLIALVKASLWQFSPMDLGDHGPAISALTDDKKYLDELKCLGYFVPPEAILNGQTGNRAKATVMSDSATVMNEPVNQGIVSAFNSGPVNYLLWLAGGDAAVGSVWFETEPLADPQASYDQVITQAALQGKGPMLSYLLKYFDIDAIFTRNGLSKRPQPLDDKELIAITGDPNQGQGDGQSGDNGDKAPNGKTAGLPNANGNGQANGAAGANGKAGGRMAVAGANGEGN